MTMEGFARITPVAVVGHGTSGSRRPPVPALAGFATAYAMWPGVVVEIGLDGAIHGANDSGALLVDSLRDGELGTLVGLIALAIEGGGSVRDRIEVETDGGTRWFECVAMPTDESRAVVLARDETYDVNIRQALFESRQRYRDLVAISSDFAWETDAEGAFVFVSPHGALGYSAEDLVGRRPGEFLVDLGLDEGEPKDLPFHTRRPVTHARIWVRDVDGAEACLLASAVPVLDADGTWRGARGLCRDITGERLRDSQLAQAKAREQVVAYVVNQIREEARPQAMLEAAVAMLGRATSSVAAVYSDDADGARELSAVCGAWPEEITSERIAVLVRGGGASVEARIGDVRILVRPTRYHGNVNGAVALARPVASTEWSEDEKAMLEAVGGQLAIALRQIADQRELERLSRTDTLTGLMNRRAFQDAMERALVRARYDGEPGIVLYIDLDNFKQINDVLGHETGDAVLREVAAVLVSSSRVNDLVARIGGDEFVLWLNGMDFDAAMGRCQDIVESIAVLARYSPDGAEPLSASIGVAAFDPHGGESQRALLARADTAMYEAKKKGKNRWTAAARAMADVGRPGGAAGPAIPAAAVRTDGGGDGA